MAPLTVGVTGHRPNRLGSADTEALRLRVREVLRALRAARGEEGGSPTLLSGLAEGADRIVAREAMGLGFRLEAVLPFHRADYEKDFGSEDSRREYRDLLSLAAAVTELGGSRSARDTRDAAYGAVGRELLDRADALVAIWDGRRARGEGGTAEVLADALGRSLPVVWIGADPPHAAWLLTGEGDIAFDTERLRASLRERPSPER